MSTPALLSLLHKNYQITAEINISVLRWLCFADVFNKAARWVYNDSLLWLVFKFRSRKEPIISRITEISLSWIIFWTQSYY